MHGCLPAVIVLLAPIVIALLAPIPADAGGALAAQSAQDATASQDAPSPTPVVIVDLVTLFEAGAGLVDDLNGDGVVDFVNASLVLGDPPSVAELAAATEISARLGFETTALDLPLQRWSATGEETSGEDGEGRGDSLKTASRARGARIVVGRGGLASSGLVSPGIDPLSLAAGEGAVSVLADDEHTWIIVVGGDDAGVLSAARTFAGALPHTEHLSSPELSAIRNRLDDAIAAALANDSVAQDLPHSVRLSQARSHSGEDGIVLVVADVFLPGDLIETALDSLTPLVDAPEVVVRLFEIDAASEGAPGGAGEGGGDETAARGRPQRVVRLPATREPELPGPIPGRPGAGNKASLDLSNLYTSDGLLGGGAIPNRIDAMLVPGEGGSTGLPELGARLGLEAAGLVVPLVEPAALVRRPASRPTLVLTGTGGEHPLIQSLADSGLVDLNGLDEGEGLIQLVPEAFGSKSALVLTGADGPGAERALAQVARTFPNLAERGDDRPTVADVEADLWRALSGRSPLGQAAIGMYKLGKIIDGITASTEVDSDSSAVDGDSFVLPGRPTSASVLVSVEKADDELAPYIRTRAAEGLGLVPDSVRVTIDDRDVRGARTIFASDTALAGEVERFWERFRAAVLPHAAAGEPIQVHARLSEPPEIREGIAEEAKRELIAAGADPDGTSVEVLSAFKQGYSWLYESVLPRLAELQEDGGSIGEIVIRFRRNDPPEAWPQQAIHTPVRWLHEIFPIDEVLARDLGIELDRVRFEQTVTGPIYEISVGGIDGAPLLNESYEPRWVLRPYVDRFRDYEQVRVTTGWLRAEAGPGGAVRTVADERIPTDPETFWDYFQAEVLPAVYDYVMELHDGLPRGGSADAPYFGELTVELEMSEPDHRLEIDNEIHSTMDALHEEIYFATIEFFDLIGRHSRGQGLTFPGRVIPVMRPAADGAPPRMKLSFTGFASSRPAVVVRLNSPDDSAELEARLDIPKTGLERPSARLASVTAGVAGLERLALRVRVDTDADVRDSLLTYATPETVDRNMVSAEQVEATIEEMERLRTAGLYTDELAYRGLGQIEIWAESSHEQDPESRRTAILAANGSPPPPPDWRSLIADGFAYSGQRLVQWETPMPPPEGHRILAEMAGAFEEARMYRLGHSYLGREIWALDLTTPVYASHFSRAKASVHKPTVIYSARQHANEVSSTSHVLRHAELLLTDPDWRQKLDRVNVVIHPFTNPDGAQLAFDLYRITPDFILHAGYLAALGQDVSSGGGDDHPIYPEAPLRQRLWEMWTPDIFLNPHGYPSHQVVQLFSEYSGLVRRGRVTERNWGFNKGWFIPSFGYLDSPDHPRHKDAAFKIRDYITEAINSNPDVFELNQRTYDRYRRYGAEFDPEVFRLPMTDSVLIHMPLKGSTGGGGGFDPAITIWSGITEAPDETAYGDWMELVAKAGLSWDQAILDYLHDGNHEVKRSGSSFFGGVSLRLNRPRPPEEAGEADEGEKDEDEANGRTLLGLLGRLSSTIHRRRPHLGTRPSGPQVGAARLGPARWGSTLVASTP